MKQSVLMKRELIIQKWIFYNLRFKVVQFFEGNGKDSLLDVVLISGLLGLECLGQVTKRVQDKQCLGQVFCIRELALFLFLAADLQGFFKMCWY